MATRFGFMKSTKAGKCFYCKVDLVIGEQCGFDNNVKRRTCMQCAKDMIAEGVVEAVVDQSKQPSSDDVIAKLDSLTGQIKTLADSIDKRFAAVWETMGGEPE